MSCVTECTREVVLRGSQAGLIASSKAALQNQWHVRDKLSSFFLPYWWCLRKAWAGVDWEANNYFLMNSWQIEASVNHGSLLQPCLLAVVSERMGRRRQHFSPRSNRKAYQWGHLTWESLAPHSLAPTWNSMAPLAEEQQGYKVLFESLKWCWWVRHSWAKSQRKLQSIHCKTYERILHLSKDQQGENRDLKAQHGSLSIMLMMFKGRSRSRIKGF